jgi:hypothetical protein
VSLLRPQVDFESEDSMLFALLGIAGVMRSEQGLLAHIRAATPIEHSVVTPDDEGLILAMLGMHALSERLAEIIDHQADGSISAPESPNDVAGFAAIEDLMR